LVIYLNGNTVLTIGIGSGLESTQNIITALHTETSEASDMYRI
jgi:hypothetical protein